MNYLTPIEVAPTNRGKASSTSEEVSGKLDDGHVGVSDESDRRISEVLRPMEQAGAQTIGEILGRLKAGTPLAEIVEEVKKKTSPSS